MARMVNYLHLSTARDKMLNFPKTTFTVHTATGFYKQKKGLLSAIPLSASNRLLNLNLDLLGGLSTFNLECNSAFLLTLNGNLASL